MEEAAFSMRAPRQGSTNYTSFFLMFNRHPRLPVEVFRLLSYCMSLHSLHNAIMVHAFQTTVVV